MARPSIFEFAGGEPAFLALATAHHQRCLQDPVLNHPFSHLGTPQHVERLASYWAEVFGGPSRYSQSCGGHSAMLGIHAGEDPGAELGVRFADCFAQAADDAGLPEDPSSGPPCARTWSGRSGTCSPTVRPAPRCRPAYPRRAGPGTASSPPNPPERR